MRTLLFFMSVIFLRSAQANTYYFSASGGDDSRSSSQAQNSSTPWKSVGKLNSFFSSLQPGDNVLFKRGETFFGSVNISRSGSSGSPITVGAYGSGDRPIITSLVTLSGWTANSSYKGVYDCSANSALGSEISILLLNDAQQGMGRYPNKDAANKGYLILESHSGSSSITDKELTSTINWKGAEMVLRSSHWSLDRHLITGHSGGTLYYSGTFSPRDNYGYFIQNSIKALDQKGEWYYNSSTKKVSMYFGTSSPGSYSVKAASSNNMVNASGRSYITFDNLTIKGATENGIDVNSGNNITVQNCDILFSGINGVSITNHTNFKLENCTVLNSNNNGVAAGSSNSYAVIRNNIIKNSYTIPGLGGSFMGQGAGLRISNNGLAEYNQIINCGYVSINMSGDYTVVKNNYIDSFCYIKDDGAAVYLSNGNNITNKGRKIIGNIVLNGVGAPAGTNTTTSSADGVYMDDNVNNVEISGNTIVAANRGLYLHNSRDIIAKNNTLYNNNWGQLHMKHDVLGGLIRNQTITKNIFFSKILNQSASVILTNKDDADIRSMGRIDSNYYARPADNTNLIYTQTGYNTSSPKSTRRDFSEWKSVYSKDASSKLSAKQSSANPDDYIKFIYNASKVSKTFALNSSYIDAKNTRYSSNITLAPYTSAVLIKDGTTTSPENAAPTVNITSPSDNAGYTAPATINITAAASDDDGTVSKVEFYKGSTLLYTDYSSPYSYSWSNVSAGTYTLTAKATDNDGATATSSDVTISVGSSSTGNKAPTVNLTSPSANATYSTGATVTITATATDADGSISKVDFYSGSKLLHTEYNGIYTYSWTNVSSGTYTITAKATDNKGAVTTSSSVTITVGSSTVNKAPVVSLTSPSNNATYKTSATINMSASASDADGSISKVEFYNGSRLLHTEYNGLFTYSWTNVSSGTYTITAKATDNKGLATTSASVKISVTSSRPAGNNQSSAIAAKDIDLSKQFVPGEMDLTSAHFSLFPNPATEYINLAFGGVQTQQQVILTIQNTAGIVLKKYPVVLSGKSLKVDISSLNTGMFIINLRSSNINISSKFVKAK